MIWALLMLVLTAFNCALEIFSRRRLRELRAMRAETEDPEYPRAQAARIVRQIAGYLREEAELRYPPGSPVRHAKLSLAAALEDALDARRGRS